MIKYIFLHIPKTAGTSVISKLPGKKLHNGPFVDQYSPWLSEADSNVRPIDIWPRHIFEGANTGLHPPSGIIYKEASKGLAETIEEKFYHNKIDHFTLEQRFETNIIPIKDFDKYFSFCFVRNPWDRLLSIAFAIFNEKIYEELEHPTNTSKEQYLEYSTSTDCFSNHFVREIEKLGKIYGPKWYYKKHYNVFINEKVHFLKNTLVHYLPSPPHLDGVVQIENQLFDINSLPKSKLFHHSFPAGHLVPQNLYTYDKKNDKKVKFIGRYENLEKDFEVIMNKLNLPYDINLPRINETNSRREGRHYTEFYTKEARDIVAKMYAEDIEMFGYKFGK